MSKITDRIIDKFMCHRRNGLSYNESCRQVNIPTSSMRYYLRKIGRYEEQAEFGKPMNQFSKTVRESMLKYSLLKTIGKVHVIIESQYFTFNDVSELPFKVDESNLTIPQSVYISMKNKKSCSEEYQHVVSNLEQKFKIDFKNNTINGYHVTRPLIKLLSKAIKNNNGVDPIVKFTKKLLKNKDKRIIEQLYPFMQHNGFKISDDGNIVAYKGITKNYLDIYTKSINNAIGQVVKIPRQDVDNDPNNTCSHGLHLGSFSYAKWYGQSGRVVECHANPKHVISVPMDYDGEKCRVCKYTVIKNIEVD